MTDHDFIDKKALSERDICTKFITPAIKDVAAWTITRFYEEFTLEKTVSPRGANRSCPKSVSRANRRS
jgi:hypothetical protein